MNDSQGASSLPAGTVEGEGFGSDLEHNAGHPRVFPAAPSRHAYRPSGFSASPAALISEEVLEAHADLCRRMQDTVLSGVPLYGALRFDRKNMRWEFIPDDCDKAVPVSGETLEVTIL